MRTHHRGMGRASLLSALVIATLLAGALPASSARAAFSDAVRALVPGGRVISVWGDPRDGGRRKHQGVDIGAPMGTAVHALEPGIVTFSGWNSLGGNSVTYRDDAGRRWYFTHLQQPSTLRPGNRIARGVVVGRVGDTGNAKGAPPHLHFQVSAPGGVWADPEIVLKDWNGPAPSPAAPAPATDATPPGSGAWYRYQGEPSSFDRYDNQALNCGPASIAMAIQYANNVSVPVREIRTLMGANGNGTTRAQITAALEKWGVEHRGGIRSARDVGAALARGNTVVLALNMDQITPGADADGRSTDPDLRTGAYYTGVVRHWIVVKGVTPDGEHFEVYDGNVWGKPGYRKYWYADGAPKGLDRLYPVAEVERGMIANAGADAENGVEILGGRQPQVSQGQRLDAEVDYYALTEEDTGSDTASERWGVMYNGDYYHWGAVAVDPEYIPLGTKLRIAGWGDMVFEAKDTNDRAIGYDVLVYWPGGAEQAARLGELKGGKRAVTLLDSNVAFSDAAPGGGPGGPGIEIVQRADDARRWVTLELSAQDATGMMISNDPLFADGFEEPYAGTKEWTLDPGDGLKTVFARFKQANGAWSETVSAQVEVGEQPPVGSVVLAPDPRIALAAPLGGSTVASVGPQPVAEGRLRYRPLGPNLLRNSSFETFAGGIPAEWESPLREEAAGAYDPRTGAAHGALAVRAVAHAHAYDDTGAEAPLTQRVLLAPNTLYTLSAWVEGAGARLELQELESRGVESRGVGRHRKVSPEITGWQRLAFRFRSSPRATDAEVRLSGDEVSWDAVQLEPGDTATPYRGDGVLLERPATNLVPNASLELDADSWSGLSTAVELVSAPDYARQGRRALAVEKTRPGRAATYSPVGGMTPGMRYAYSVFVRLADGADVTNDTLRGWYVEGAEDAEAVDIDALTDLNRPEMTWSPVGGGWHRGHFAFTATRERGLFGAMSTDATPNGFTYYLDGAQLEEGELPSSYLDGSLGEGYTWMGEPYRSASARAPAALALGATEGASGALMFRARAEGGAPEGAVALRLGGWRVEVSGGRLALRAGEQVVGAAPPGGHAGPPLRGDVHLYVISWDGRAVSFWRDAAPLGVVAAPPPPPGSGVALGPAEGGAYANEVVGDVSLWRSPLPGAAQQHQVGAAPLDPGLAYTNAREVTVSTAAADPSGGAVAAAYSTDAKTWRARDEATGPWTLDLGGEEGQKTLWVRYTDEDGNALVYRDTVTLDLTPPEVEEARRIGDLLVLRFSEPVDPDGVRRLRALAGERRLPGVWSYAEGSRQATFPLPPETTAGLRVEIGELRDRAGNVLADAEDAEVTP